MKVLAFLLILSLGITVWWVDKRDGSLPANGWISPQTSQVALTENQVGRFNWGDIEYEYLWFTVNDFERVRFESNLDRLRSVREIIKDEDCKQLINGGFYDKNNQHLGWVVSAESQLSNSRNSELFNGYLFRDESGIRLVQEKPVNGKIVWGVQTGPVLMIGGAPKRLAVKNDEPKRRAIALVTNNNELIFAVIYKKDSLYVGPYLNDLPMAMEEMVRFLEVEIESAINLDGGSASAFWDGKRLVEEINPIGGYFCVKD